MQKEITEGTTNYQMCQNKKDVPHVEKYLSQLEKNTARMNVQNHQGKKWQEKIVKDIMKVRKIKFKNGG